VKLPDSPTSRPKPQPAPASHEPKAAVASAPRGPDGEKPAPKAAATPTAGQNYHVKKGDTLWDISRKAYGDPTRWPEIRDANAGKVTHDGNIQAGITLRIPPDTAKDAFKPGANNKYTPASKATTTQQQVQEETAVKKELLQEFRNNLDKNDRAGLVPSAAARASSDARATVSRNPEKAAILERADGRSARAQATTALTNAAAAQREAQRTQKEADTARTQLNSPSYKMAVRTGDIPPAEHAQDQQNLARLDRTAQKAQERSQSLLVNAKPTRRPPRWATSHRSPPPPRPPRWPRPNNSLPRSRRRSLARPCRRALPPRGPRPPSPPSRRPSR